MNLLTQLQTLAKSEEGQHFGKAVADLFTQECDALQVEKPDMLNQFIAENNKHAPDQEEPTPAPNEDLKQRMASLQATFLQGILGQGGPQLGSKEFSDSIIAGMFPNHEQVIASLGARVETDAELKASMESLRQKALQLLENFRKGSNEFCDNISSDPMTCFHYMAQIVGGPQSLHSLLQQADAMPGEIMQEEPVLSPDELEA